MKLNFRLKEILDEHRVNRRGIIKNITDHTSLERHQVATLMANKTRYLSLDTLAQICDYLIQHHRVNPQDLPGILFGKEPDSFWDLFRREHLEVCLGIRRSGDEAWVTDSDAFMQGTLLNGISAPGLAPRRKPQFLHQHLVPAPHAETGAPELSAAKNLYKAFAQQGSNRALVAIGSVKICSISELVVANAFRAEPFERQDSVRRPQDRKCPFLFAYRSDDPKPASCCGGIKLARSKPLKKPGIYYEQADGQWIGCPWSKTADAAIIFYVYRPPVERLEVVLGGFSGRATRGLALALRAWAGKLWPPCYATPQLEIGAFVVKFSFAAEGSAGGSGQPMVEVIPLPGEVLKRRLKE